MTLVDQLGANREVADPKREFLAVDCDPQAGCFALVNVRNQKVSGFDRSLSCKQLVRYNPVSGETAVIVHAVTLKNGKLQNGKQKCPRRRAALDMVDAYASLIIQRGETEAEPVILVSSGGYIFRFQTNGNGQTIHDPYKLLRKSKHWDDNPVLGAGVLSYSSDENVTAVIFSDGEKKIKGLSIDRTGRVSEQNWAIPAHLLGDAYRLLYRLNQDGTAEVVTSESVLRCSAPKGCVVAYKLASPGPIERPNLGFTGGLCSEESCRDNQFDGETVYNADGASLREVAERIQGIAPTLCSGLRGAYSYVDIFDTYEGYDPGKNFFYGGIQGFRRSGELLFGDSCRRVVKSFAPGTHPRLSRVLTFKTVTAANLAENKLPLHIPEAGTAELTVHKTVQPYDKLEQGYTPEGVDTPLDLQFSAKLTVENPYIDLPTTLTPGVYNLSLVFTGESGSLLSTKRNLYVGISGESFLPKFIESQLRTIFFAGEPEGDIEEGVTLNTLHRVKQRSVPALHLLTKRVNGMIDSTNNVTCYRGKRTAAFDGQDLRSITCELGERFTAKKKVRKKNVTVQYESFVPFQVTVLNPDEVTVVPLGEYMWERICTQKKSGEACRMKKADKIE